MAASYPGSAKSFTALNAGDVVQDTDVEQAYDEITAIEQALLTSGLAHNLVPDTSARTLGTAAKPWGAVFFPAVQVPSADANALDDYKEGTWTPVLGGAGGTSGQAYTFQQGLYVKVGQLVTAWFYVALSAKGTITGAVQIQGLPFTASNSINAMPAPLYYAALGTNWISVLAGVNPNATTAQVVGNTAAAATNTTALATGDIAATTLLAGVLVYRASA